ncbi:hypothetical protein [Mycobacterium sp. UM_WGJ]|uniref:hypothetical protein n=1 Tax=Mycobacterium sp. UM_WGJ TaxID=1370120 RepID=UPI0012DC5EAA|nr:hypothetical protein [Mycobacterium sp. UM_WGJ]
MESNTQNFNEPHEPLFGPQDRERWISAGLDVWNVHSYAKRLGAAGLGPEDAKRWAAAGLRLQSLYRMARFIDAPLSFEEMLELLNGWRAPGRYVANVRPVNELEELLDCGFAVTELKRLIACGFTGNEIYQWQRNSNIPLADWADWKAFGIGLEDAMTYQRRGIAPSVAHRWINTNLSPGEIATYIDMGWSPLQAEAALATDMQDSPQGGSDKGARERKYHTSAWPPVTITLPDWDNGGGVAVICDGIEHRVVRREGQIVALDHPDVDAQAAAAAAAAARGEIKKIGYRYFDNQFNMDAIKQGSSAKAWAPPSPRSKHTSGRILDLDGLPACVRLAIEGFAPCCWCGELLAHGNVCTVSDSPFCVLANGTGWRTLIPPGWVQATLAGITTAEARFWPRKYAWRRNGPTTKVRQIFVFSPYWPEIHPRRFAKLVREHRVRNSGTYESAFQAVIDQLRHELGEPRSASRG